MNGVLGMLQLLELTSLTVEQQEYIDTIKISGESLLRLINGLLDLSKIEAGRLELEINSFSIRHTLGAITTLFKAKVAEKGLYLNCHIAPNIPDTLIGDENRLRQILVNLIGNAVKFTESGGIDLEVKLLAETENEVKVGIEVLDTGIGMTEEQVENLFQPICSSGCHDRTSIWRNGLRLTYFEEIGRIDGGGISGK